MAYSSDLRTRVVEYVLSGKSRVSAAKFFNVAEKTVRNWMKLHKETGSVDPRPHRGGKRSTIDSEEFKSYVDANPGQTLKVIGKHFGLSYQGAAYNLSKHGYVNKKNTSIRRKG